MQEHHICKSHTVVHRDRVKTVVADSVLCSTFLPAHHLTAAPT